MELKEAINEIRSVNRHYEKIDPKMSQSYFSTMCRKAESGLLKNETLKEFLNRFGYDVFFDTKVIKRDV